MDDPRPPRPAQEPDDDRPEDSVAASPLVWVLLGIVVVALFVAAALAFGGKLG